MANEQIIFDVGGNTRSLDASLNASISNFERRTQNLSLGSLGRSGLGNISRDFNQFERSLESASARVLSFGITAGAILGVERGFRQLVSTTLDVEKRLTNINTVLQINKRNLSDFGTQLFSIAGQTGQTFKTISDAALEFSRQGLQIPEVLKRTRDAAILSRQSNLDLVESVEALTAAQNSFNKEFLTSTVIINKLANVDQQFAVSSGDLVEAIRRTGASAQAAGVSFSQLIALVTSAQQITQKGGANIGTALNSVLARLGDPSRLDALRELGVAINSTQSGVEKLQVLSNAIKGATTEQAALIKSQAGGIRNLNILSSVLDDLSSKYSIYGRALKTASQDSNAALQRNEQQNQTLAALANRTLANLTKFGSQVGNLVLGPAIKNVLGIGNDILGALNSSIEKGGEDTGKSIGAGIAKGIGEFLGGPGLLLAGLTVTRLLGKLAVEAGTAFKVSAGIGSDRRNQELQITQILAQQPNLIRQVNAGYITQLEAVKLINAELFKGAELSATRYNLISAALVNRTGKTKAVGYIPEMSEKMGAYAAGYTPGQVKELTIPSIGKVVYNSAEKVKYFPGLSQPAIIPPQGSKAGVNYGQQFQATHGFSPYAANGVVPEMKWYEKLDIKRKEALKKYLASNQDYLENIYPGANQALDEIIGNIPNKKHGFSPYKAEGHIPNYAGFIGPTKRLLQSLKESGVGYNRWGDESHYKPLQRWIEMAASGKSQTGKPIYELFHEAGHDISYQSGESGPKWRFDYKGRAQNERFANSRALSLMEKMGMSPELMEQFKPFAQKIYQSYRKKPMSQKAYFKDIPNSAFSLGDIESMLAPDMSDRIGMSSGFSPYANKGFLPNFANFPTPKDYLGRYANGLAEGVSTTDAFSKYHRDAGMAGRLTWRYHSKNQNVRWTDVPTTEAKLAVDEFLAKRGIIPSKHALTTNVRFGDEGESGISLSSGFLPYANKGYIPNYGISPQRNINTGAKIPGKFTIGDESSGTFLSFRKRVNELDLSNIGSATKGQGYAMFSQLAAMAKKRNIPIYSQDLLPQVRNVAGLDEIERLYTIFPQLRWRKDAKSVSGQYDSHTSGLKYNFNSLPELENIIKDNGLVPSVRDLIRDTYTNFNGGLVPNFMPKISMAQAAKLLKSKQFQSLTYQKSSGELGTYNSAQYRVRRDKLVGASAPEGFKNWTQFDEATGSLVLHSVKEGEQEAKFRRFNLSGIKQIRAQGQIFNIANGGLIPNFNALSNAVTREQSAGINLGQIKIGSAPQLASGLNPLGLGVYNTRDEPQGLSQGINRAIKEGRNPKTYGVPNFAIDFESTNTGNFQNFTSSQDRSKFQAKYISLINEVSDGTKSIGQSFKEIAKAGKSFHALDEAVQAAQKSLRASALSAEQSRNRAKLQKEREEYDMLNNTAGKNEYARFDEAQRLAEYERELGAPGIPTKKQSLFSRGFNKVNDFINSPRGQNAALISSFLVPAIAGGISELFGDKTVGQRGGKQLTQSSANIFSYGALGAQFGGVYGAGAGLGIGAILEAPKIIDSFTDTLPDLQREMEKLTSKINQANDSFSNILQTNEKLSQYQRGELNLTPKQYGQIKTQQQNQISQLSLLYPQQASEIRRAALSGNVEDLERAFAPAAAIDQQNQAKIQIKALQEKVRSSSGLKRAFTFRKPLAEDYTNLSSAVLSQPSEDINNKLDIFSFILKNASENPENNYLNRLDSGFRKFNKAKLGVATYSQLREDVGDFPLFGGRTRYRELTGGTEPVLTKSQKLFDEAKSELSSVLGDIQSQGKYNVSPLIENLKNINPGNINELGKIYDTLQKLIPELKNSLNIPAQGKNSINKDTSDLVRAFYDLKLNIGLFSNKLEQISITQLSNIQRNYENIASSKAVQRTRAFGNVSPFSSFGGIEIEKQQNIDSFADKINQQLEEITANKNITNRGLPAGFLSKAIEIARTSSGRNPNVSQGQFLKNYKERLAGDLSGVLPGYNEYTTTSTASEYKTEFNDPFKAINSFLQISNEDLNNPEKVKKYNQDLNNFINGIRNKRNDLSITLDSATGKDKEELENMFELYNNLIETFDKNEGGTKVRSDALRKSLEDYKKIIAPNEAAQKKEEFINSIIQRDAAFIENVQTYRTNLRAILEQYNITDPNKTNYETLRKAELQFAQSRLQENKGLYAQGKISGSQLQVFTSEYANAELSDKGQLSGKTLGSLLGSGFQYNNRDFFSQVGEDAKNAGAEMKAAFNDAFQSFSDGSKSASDAARDLGISIATNILNKVADIGFNSLFGSLFNSGSGLLNGLFSGSKTQGRGYAGGGFVGGGSGMRDDVPASLPVGSFVLRRGAVQKYGLNMLNGINSGLGFASGGGVNLTLKNAFAYNNAKKPTSGFFDVDPRLSAIGQTDDNNPQNAIKFDREQTFYSYRKTVQDYKVAKKNFDAAQRQRIYGAYFSAATTIGGQAISSKGFSSSSPSSSGSPPPVKEGDFSNRYGGLYNLGGVVRRFASGGLADNMPAMLTQGEFVVQPDAVRTLGVPFMNRLNSGGIVPQYFAAGGLVGNNINTINPIIQGNNNDSLQSVTAALLQSVRLLTDIRDIQLGTKDKISDNNPNKAARLDRNKENDVITPNITIQITMQGNGQTTANTQANGKNGNDKDGQNLNTFASLMGQVAIQKIIEQQRPGGLLQNTRIR